MEVHNEESNDHPLKRQRNNTYGFASDVFTPSVLPSPCDLPGMFRTNSLKSPVSIRTPQGAGLLQSTGDASARLLLDQHSDPLKGTPVPVFAQWYKEDSLHPIEIEHFGDFCNDRGTTSCKDKETYMSYRNFMVKAYRENPSQYLSATNVRARLNGDASAIYRLHEFLEHWGLINYGHMERGGNSCWELTSSAHPVVYDQASSVGIRPTDAASYMEYTKKVREQKFGYQMEPAKEKTWSTDETRLLLEGIEKHADKWFEIAAYVNGNRKEGSKTPEDCLLHFVRLPIQDPFLDPPLVNPAFSHKLPPLPEQEGGTPVVGGTPTAAHITTTTTTTTTTTSSTTTTSTPTAAVSVFGTPSAVGAGSVFTPDATVALPDPFSNHNTPNPVLSTVAFLASLVNPAVANAAAAAALKCLTEELQTKVEDEMNAYKKSQETANTPTTTVNTPTSPGSLLEKTGSDSTQQQGEASNDTTGNSEREKQSEVNSNNSSNPNTPAVVIQNTPTIHDMKGTLPKNVTELIRQKIALDKAQISSATAALLGAASVRAHRMAVQEEVSMQQSLGKAVESQLKKLQLKLDHFNKIDDMIQRERQYLYENRLQLHEQKCALVRETEQLSARSTEPGSAATSEVQNSVQLT